MSALSVTAAAEEHGSAIALLDERGALDWSSLAQQVRERCRALLRCGLSPADPEARIALLGAPIRERVIDALAAIEMGVPLVMLHPRWTDAEHRRALALCRPSVVIGLGWEPADAGQDATSFDDAPRCASDSTPLAMLFTSGTTARPRAAVLSRRAFVAAARASASVLPLGPGDRWLLCMPIAHVGGLSILTRCLLARAAIAVAGPFEVSRTIAAIERLSPTRISLVPTMLHALLQAGWRGAPGLDAIVLGGAGCPERVLMRAAELGLPVRTTYGLTEACSQVTLARADVRGPSDGAGEPLPGIEVRIGAQGTILVRGPTMFEGWFPPGAEPSPFDAEGFYDTGDLGEFDAAGRLHVHARRSDLIVTGGENVAPAEVERALERIAGVRAACVFGVPDDRWGQIVAAAIVAGPEAPDDDAIVAALHDLAPFKRPRRIARLEALATNAAGKLDRRASAELARARLREVRRS